MFPNPPIAYWPNEISMLYWETLSSQNQSTAELYGPTFSPKSATRGLAKTKPCYIRRPFFSNRPLTDWPKHSRVIQRWTRFPETATSGLVKTQHCHTKRPISSLVYHWQTTLLV